MSRELLHQALMGDYPQLIAAIRAHLAQPQAEPVAINYVPLHEFATRLRISYNELCAAVHDSLSITEKAHPIDGFGGNLDSAFDAPAQAVPAPAVPDTSLKGFIDAVAADRAALLSAAPAVPLPPPELTWLYTHCRAIGMTEHSDSKNWEHDIALFTTRLQDRIRQLESVAPVVREPSTYRQIAEATGQWADVPSDKVIGIWRAAEQAHGITAPGSAHG